MYTHVYIYTHQQGVTSFKLRRCKLCCVLRGACLDAFETVDPDGGSMQACACVLNINEYMFIYIYIYRYIERERCISYIYIYIIGGLNIIEYIYIYIYVYIYIYICVNTHTYNDTCRHAHACINRRRVNMVGENMVLA